MLHYRTVISCFLVHSKKKDINKITYIIVGFYICKSTKVIRFVSIWCILVVPNAIRVRVGALDPCWHHFLGRVSMYLEMISSITSSAPPPIDINLPSLREEPRSRGQDVAFMVRLGCSGNMTELTCTLCWPARRWWSPFLPSTAGSCRSPP